MKINNNEKRMLVDQKGWKTARFSCSTDQVVFFK